MIEDKRLKRWMLGGEHFKVVREVPNLYVSADLYEVMLHNDGGQYE